MNHSIDFLLVSRIPVKPIISRSEAMQSDGYTMQ